MTAEELRTVLIRRWRIIVACTLCAGLGAFLGTLLMTPVYQSTVTLEVQASLSNSDTVAALIAARYTSTEAQVATTNPVLAAVAARYPGLSVAQLRREVSTTPAGELLQISVLDASPTRAAALANDLAGALITQLGQSLQQQHNDAQQPILGRIASYQATINSLTTRLARLPQTPENASQIATLKAQLADAEDRYTQWQQALSRLVNAQALASVSLQVVDPAQPSARPVRPIFVVNVAGGLFFGMLLGIFLIVLPVQIDQRVRSAASVTAVLNYPVLAEVGATPAPRRAQGGTPRADPEMSLDPYHTLATALRFLSLERPLRSLTITAAGAADDAKAIAADLALALAANGTKTLLVDADLRRPSQAQRFGVANAAGLSDAVLAFNQPDATADTLYPFVHRLVNVGPPALMVMPAGTPPPNPSDVLKSRAMGRLVKAIFTVGAEVVIFDVPPAAVSFDARILAANADGVLIVVDRSRARRGQLLRTKARLAAAGAKVLGCVIIDARQTMPIDAPAGSRPDGRLTAPPASGRVTLPPAGGRVTLPPATFRPTAPPAIGRVTAPPMPGQGDGAPPGETMPYG
jgi:capsular exopolysaccharide synthesis family protein